MGGTWSQMMLVLLPVVIGATIGVVPTILMELSRSRAKLRTRWDPTLEDVCAEFAATARRILDLAEAVHEPADDAIESVRNEHGRLQRFMVEIRLLAGPEVQLAARHVVRHTWALQVAVETGVDPRAGTYPAVSPRERSLSSLFDFYLAVRRQLRVPEADRLLPLNPPLDARQMTKSR